MLKFHTSKPFYIALAAFTLIGVGRIAWTSYMPPMIFNYTHSEPYGFYQLKVLKPSDYTRGMTVLFPVPEPFKAMVYGRGWINKGTPLMKQIWGLAGDTVCINNKEATVNGRYLGPISSADSYGRPLPALRGCFVVPDGFFFPAGNYITNSFDGRYFGPVPLTNIQAEAEPTSWTFSPY